MIYTHHAETRMRQRSFNSLDVELIVGFGKKFWKHGSQIAICNKKAVQKMVSTGISPKIAEPLRGAYVVFCDDIIVTVAYCSKRLMA